MNYNFHTHTHFCGHANGEIEEYIKNAVAANMTNMGFSEHFPYMCSNGVQSGYRLQLDDIEKYFAQINELREKYKDEINIKIGFEMEDYLNGCFRFCKNAAERGIISVLRLWNMGGKDRLNREIIEKMHAFFDDSPSTEWKTTYSGYRIRDKIFLEWGNLFDWPDLEADYRGNSHSCYGLRDQVGVLSDGTVVPCCLDADGAISLGNIFTTPLSEILSSARAVKLKESFQNRQITEELCQRCGFAHGRFGK